MNVPAISAPLLGFFRRIVRGYFRRHFHAVRIANQRCFRGVTGPLIVYANHSSWWDPMVSILLAARLMPERMHYAPMDAAALEKYGLLKRLGIFPVEMKTARGAVQFLRTGEAILLSGGVLWVTPQGRFSDARERPLVFKPGMAALAARVAKVAGACTLLPLAIEYPFWDERLPETLLHFAEPLLIHAGDGAEEIEAKALAALDQVMEELKRKAVDRDAAAFELLAQGTLGTGGFYALGQRVVAAFRRRRYMPEHSPSQSIPAVAEEGVRR
jgi:1-acyl-sn-glycerol-3-phosphate acyltransferase